MFIELVFFLDKASLFYPFKFENMWLRDNDLHETIKSWFQHEPDQWGSRMYNLSRKLSFVKAQLKEWNKNTFKNIFDENGYIKDQLI